MGRRTLRLLVWTLSALARSLIAWLRFFSSARASLETRFWTSRMSGLSERSLDFEEDPNNGIANSCGLMLRGRRRCGGSKRRRQ